MKKLVVKDLYRVCPKCGNFSHYSLEQIYCVNCGARMIDKCPNCGELIIYPTAKYCPVCGERYLNDDAK